MHHALQVEHLSKSYRRADGSRFAALADLSFELPQGASLGLCGRNGAGKSTLLKILAGAVRQDGGRWRAQQPLRAVVELGVGFHPDLSGRENALQLAALDGLAGRAAKAHAAGALEFAGLVQAADEPLRTWSSGMQLRLAFAAAIAHPCRVLLLDEVFAVGDQEFQARCVERVRALQEAGTSIVLCSHSLYDLRQLCSHALWLEGGRDAAFGECAETTARYAAAMRAGSAGGAARGAATGPRIDRLELAGPRGAVQELESGADLVVRVHWSSPVATEVQCGVGLLDPACELVAACGTHLSGLAPQHGVGGVFELRLPRLALLSGSFRVAAWLFDRHGLQRHDEALSERPLTVLARGGQVGRVMLEHQWSHSRTTPTIEQPPAALPAAPAVDAHVSPPAGDA